MTSSEVVDQQWMPSMLADFVDEASELLDRFNEDLLRLEHWVTTHDPSELPGGGPTLLNDMFRAAHSLKGLSAMLGLGEINALTHGIENLLDAARHYQLALSTELVNLIFQAVDELIAMVENLSHDTSEPVNSGTVLRRIETVLSSAGGGRVRPSQQEVERLLYTGGSEVADATAIDQEPPVNSVASATVRVEVAQIDRLMMTTEDLSHSIARLERLGDTLHRPAASTAALAAWERILGKIERRCDVSRSGDPATAPIETNEDLGADVQEVCRELERFQEFRETVRQWIDVVDQADEECNRLKQSVVAMRRVPITALFHRFKRIVRDMARGGDKEIRLEILGEGIDLDKQTVDLLVDPLVHVICNAVDHGIETPDDRRAAGKPPQATVSLQAFRRGGMVSIEVHDDGRGLDFEKIRRRAVAEGQLSQADADGLDRDQIEQLIWKAGFSTADRVTKISGRGMGLDIVHLRIQQLGGAIELKSEASQGTTVVIKLPASPANHA